MNSATLIDSETHPDVWVHTLGPTGTNCEAAARHWLATNGYPEDHIELHPTLEVAAEAVIGRPGHVLLGCIVYPELNHLVFQNLGTMRLVDCFIIPTHSMVVAGDMGSERPLVASHPAPVNLLDAWSPEVQLVTSNAEAALVCARGEVDACVTTSVAAAAAGLPIVKDFGPVPMGFSIHAPSTADVLTAR